MADEEQLKILKQGVKAWNEWREENSKARINLDQANLQRANLSCARLRKASLRQANLRGADIREARLNDADLSEADVSWAIANGANLSGANLRQATLEGIDLSKAMLDRVDLSGAVLEGANLSGAILEGANLSEAILEGANLSGTLLDKADLTDSVLNRAIFNNSRLDGTILWGAIIGNTVFVNVDLSKPVGLDGVQSEFSSCIGTDTLLLSRGKIPEDFLRDCGLSDVDIEHAKLANPELSNQEINTILYKIYDIRSTQAIQINPLFISYCHKDSSFVDAMEKRLDTNGIRFWRDIHNATAGRLERVIDRAMRQNPIVLLVLSKNSVQSDWVEHEARAARDLEKELKRDVLCPVALDGAWKDCAWPARLREQIMEYNILDFSNWKDEAEFTRKFVRLVDGLDLFYKK